ncbi:unnamed protein product, partial [marine sediment metagenome]
MGSIRGNRKRGENTALNGYLERTVHATPGNAKLAPNHIWNIDPAIVPMMNELRRIVFYHQEEGFGPKKIRSAQINLGTTPKLFALILEAAIQNNLVYLVD